MSDAPRTKDQEVTKAIVDPLVIIYREPGGNIVTAMHRAAKDTYQGYGLMVCDLVRHVARAFDVTEDEVWVWVDKERYHPTTEITVAS